MDGPSTVDLENPYRTPDEQELPACRSFYHAMRIGAWRGAKRGAKLAAVVLGLLAIVWWAGWLGWLLWLSFSRGIGIWHEVSPLLMEVFIDALRIYARGVLLAAGFGASTGGVVAGLEYDGVSQRATNNHSSNQTGG